MSMRSEPLLIGSDHPSLPGHFPQQAVVPGVLILDRVMAAIRREFPGWQLARLPQVKFLQPLLPDMVAEIRWQLVSESEAELRVKFEVQAMAQKEAEALLASGDLRFEPMIGGGDSIERG